MAEVSGNLSQKAYEAVELARKSGKIKKGVNEVTKAVERGEAKIVFVAENVNPKEVVMHFEPLCKEKQTPLIMVGSKEELGAAAGLHVGSVAVAIVQEGDSKELVADLKAKGRGA